MISLFVNLAYRQDNIPRTPFDDILEGVKAGGSRQMIFLVIMLIIVIFLINMIVKRRKYLPESETVKYLSGYPSFDETKEGVVEIKDNSIIFKEFAGNKTFFFIPLKQIANVTTQSKLMSALTYFAIGIPGIATERNYLTITFKQDGRDCSVRFSSQRESLVNEKLKKQILEAMKMAI